jgi:hypothetical protein
LYRRFRQLLTTAEWAVRQVTFGVRWQQLKSAARRLNMFKVLRNYCGFKVNDISKSNYPSKHGQRVRYYWVCSKRNCKPCSESICPAIKWNHRAESQSCGLTNKCSGRARLSLKHRFTKYFCVTFCDQSIGNYCLRPSGTCKKRSLFICNANHLTKRARG